MERLEELEQAAAGRQAGDMVAEQALRMLLA